MRANDKAAELDSGDGLNDQVLRWKRQRPSSWRKGNDKLYAGSGDDRVDAGETMMTKLSGAMVQATTLTWVASVSTQSAYQSAITGIYR